MQCPVCRAENVETTCRRCRADLSMLFDVERQRNWHLAAGWQALTENQPQEAARQAEWARSLRQGADDLRLLALARLLDRDFAAALQYHAALNTQ